MHLTKIFFIITSLLVLSACNLDIPEPTTSVFATANEITLSRIIDGDTFEMSNGDTVRVLGIDYPDISNNRIDKWTNLGLSEERIRFCYKEGIAMLNQKYKGKTVELTPDFNEVEKDRYGRLLLYVYVDGVDIGNELINNGYAVTYDPTESKLCSRCMIYLNDEIIVKMAKEGCLWEK